MIQSLFRCCLSDLPHLIFIHIISGIINYWRTFSPKYCIWNTSPPLLCFKKIVKISSLFLTFLKIRINIIQTYFTWNQFLNHFCIILFPKTLIQIGFSNDFPKYSHVYSSLIRNCMFSTTRVIIFGTNWTPSKSFSDASKKR